MLVISLLLCVKLRNRQIKSALVFRYVHVLTQTSICLQNWLFGRIFKFKFGISDVPIKLAKECVGTILATDTDIY